MAILRHSYRLGRDQSFDLVTGQTFFIANKDVKDVTCTFETSAEAEVTTRASLNESEFYPVRRNTTFEVVCLAHACEMHTTGTVYVTAQMSSLFPGATGSTGFGHFYVANISETHPNDGPVEFNISLRRTAYFAPVV